MMDTYWEGIYYTDGTMPQRKRFDTEEAALEWWDANADHPRAGLSSLSKIERIRER